MNETLLTIAKRYSCRAYDGRMPERKALEAIALAAVQSPSAMNRQPWEIVVIADKALVDEMDAAGMAILAQAEDKTTYERMMQRGGKLFYNAPCMFLIKKQPGTEMDIGIVSENISLAAEALGLASVICGMAAIPFSGDKGAEFAKKVGLVDGWEFGVAVLVGYAKGEGKQHEPNMTKIHYIG